MPYLKILIFFIIIIFCFWNNTQSQNVAFQKIGVKTGLSNNNIRRILKDKDELIWIATANGLNSYDGRQFKAYSTKNKQFEFSILDICEWGDTLWLGMFHDGLYVYNKVINQFTHQSKIPYLAGVLKDIVYVNSFAISHQVIWCAGADKFGNTVLIKIEPHQSKAKVFNQFNVNKGVYERENTSVAISTNSQGQQTIWLGGVEGLYEFNPYNEKFAYYPPISTNPKTLFENAVNHICLSQDKHSLFVGTSRGLRVFDIEKHHFYSLEDEKMEQGEIRHIYENANNVYLGTWNGLFIFDKQSAQWTRHEHNPQDPNSLAHNHINSINTIQEILWIGTAGGGANLLTMKSSPFSCFTRHLGDPNGLQSYALCSMIEAKSKGKDFAWIATYDGLHLFNTQKSIFQVFNRAKGKNNVIYSICEVEDQVWVGTLQGLCIFDTKNVIFTDFKKDTVSKLHEKSIYSLIKTGESPHQTLWVGTLRGLYRLDKNNADYKITEVIRNEPIMKMLSTKDHEKETLWAIGNNGLIQVDVQTNQVQYYKHDPKSINSIATNRISFINKSDEQTLWLSYTINGFTKFDIKKKQFKHYKTNDGLPHEVVSSIIPIDEENIWIATGAGLSHFRVKEQTFENFSESMGIPMDEFDGALFYKDADGRLYFGRDKGFISFHPKEIRDKPLFPPTIITSLKVFGSEAQLDSFISYKKEISLASNQSSISLEFAALNYQNNDKICYAYQLEGVDKGWVFSGSRNFVTYTDLASKEYIFKVKASNDNHVWRDKYTRLKITILPPFWALWWFKGLFLMIVLVMIGLGVKIWISRFKHKEINLQKTVEQRTEEIKKQKDELEKKQKEIEEQNGVLTVQQAELVLANATKTRLLSVVSHDVSNALSVIKYQHASLDNKIKQEENKEIKNLTLEMGKSLKHTSFLLQNLLQWSLNQLQSAKPFYIVVNLWEVVEENMDFFRAIARAKNISLINYVPKDTEVFADTNILNLVLRNLLSNAVKFTPQGTVRVSIEDQSETMLEVVIADTGIGMTDKQLMSVLGKDGYESTAGTANEKGTGLGLQLAKEYISKMNGQLNATSTPNKGSIFYFSLYKA